VASLDFNYCDDIVNSTLNVKCFFVRINFYPKSYLNIQTNFFITKQNELPRRKQRGIKNFKFCHSALDAESCPAFWIPASAGMTTSPQAAGNTTRKD
jgi:hypothetical protein